MKVLKYLAVLAVVFATSCQSVSTLIQDPRISFDSVEIASVSLTGINLLAHVGVENPNSFSIPMPRTEWELLINNVSFLNGVVENNQTLMSREKTTLSIPISFRYDNLFRTFTSLIGRREAAYKIDLGLRFPIFLLENKLFQSSYSGVLPLIPW